MAYGSTCTQVDDCNKDASLVCLNGICSCLDGMKIVEGSCGNFNLFSLFNNKF